MRLHYIAGAMGQILLTLLFARRFELKLNLASLSDVYQLFESTELGSVKR
jgi:hypothetical protein